MSAENPIEFHNQQLADKFLKVEKDPLGKTDRPTLCLYLPVFVENEEIILHANPHPRGIAQAFQTEIASNNHIVRPSTPEEILQVISVAKLKKDLAPIMLRYLISVANFRLMEMEGEIARIRQQI